MEPITVRRISPFFRSKIEAFTRDGLTPLQVRKRILSEDNVSITTQAIKVHLARRKKEIEAGRTEQIDRSRPEKRILKPQHLSFIDKTMEEDDETTSTALQQELKEKFGVEASLTTVKKARRELSWISTKSRYCQIVRDVNKVKRVEFCREMLRTNEQYNDVIFTDESTIKIESSNRMCFRREGEVRKLKGRPKHPYQVHVWAGISRRGATTIGIFTGKMDSVGYQKILEEHLLPFIRETHPDSHRLYQDNDPKHTSKSTKQWMEENGVVLLKAPPESPDLNPIENIWGHLKQHLRKHVRPHNREELIEGIGKYWESLTKPFVNKFIDHLFKVVPECIKTKGAATGY